MHLPVHRQFIRSWNDGLPTDADRDRLIKPLLPDLIGTRASAATTRARGDLAVEMVHDVRYAGDTVAGRL
jgi:hypothetical protein